MDTHGSQRLQTSDNKDLPTRFPTTVPISVVQYSIKLDGYSLSRGDSFPLVCLALAKWRRYDGFVFKIGSSSIILNLRFL